MKPKDQKDIENVEAWAEVVKSLLYPLPSDRRAEVMTQMISRFEEVIPFEYLELRLAAQKDYVADLDTSLLWHNS